MTKKLVINDRIYGKVIINSPALIELINSKPLQRLKKIAQFGIPDEYYHKKNFSRYEHSIGVMLVLKRLGASEEEQIAGLLHDVSHTAFSHVIDWVVGSGGREDYQDKQHKNFILNSEITVILKKYKYTPKSIAQYEDFGLLERSVPDLCADRVDYALREFPNKIAKHCLTGLEANSNLIVFSDRTKAKLFAINYFHLQNTHWGGFEAVVRYRLFADVLQKALDLSLISFGDFWKYDAYILKRLHTTNNHYITKILSLLKNKSLIHLPKSATVYHKKFRYVDPYIIVNRKLKRLSKIDPLYENEIEKNRILNNKGIFFPKLD